MYVFQAHACFGVWSLNKIIMSGVPLVCCRALGMSGNYFFNSPIIHCLPITYLAFRCLCRMSGIGVEIILYGPMTCFPANKHLAFHGPLILDCHLYVDGWFNQFELRRSLVELQRSFLILIFWIQSVEYVLQNFCSSEPWSRDLQNFDHQRLGVFFQLRSTRLSCQNFCPW